MTLDRRTVLKMGFGAGAGLTLGRFPLLALPQEAPIMKAIPSSGERIPVIGLGSSGTFNLNSRSSEYATAQEVIRLFEELGGKVIDTAPSYGQSEGFIGETVQKYGIQGDLFLATKVNVEGRGKDAAIRQMEESSRIFAKPTIDLMQVWNLGDSIRNLTDNYLEPHMEAVNEWKAAGRARYIGITTSRDPQYPDVEAAMNKYTVDFVQLDYSLADRIPEQRLLPLAAEKGIAVLVNRPFGSGNLFGRVRGRELPPWASEFGCETWAQYFLKFLVSHPSVTCAIPATSDLEHLRDNMGAGLGTLPDAATRQRMIEYFEG